MDDRPTFEETYPRYEFSELVRVGIAIGTWIYGTLRRAKARRRDVPPTPAGDTAGLAGRPG